ncbi:MAG: phosphatidylserine decarboxylase [Bacilli bacterium]|nr:phosphatidylserine decarboxylase [Bacilli bacterium]
MATLKVKNRKSNEIVEIKEDKTTLFLYNTILGRIILKLFILSFLSKIIGLFLDSKLSKVLINPFIKKHNIDLNDYEKEYKNFNEFFSRKITPKARKININKKSLISPCDAKLTVYQINENSDFLIKGSYYKLEDLIESSLANSYINGQILIFRLCVDDYHRYSYIDNGYKSKNTFIKGVLHAVRPIALSKYNIYKKNSREWSILHTENFGDVISIEVGALLVGKIVNHHENHKFKKGEEKGYFKFGGSTICLVFKENTVKIDKDILDNSLNNIETIVKLGEIIGKKN